MDEDDVAPESPSSSETAETENTFSAGEAGAADEGPAPTGTEVVIGEIPAADDPTTMLWTARCDDAAHDLLGHFPSRDAAEKARVEHLEAEHGGSGP